MEQHAEAVRADWSGDRGLRLRHGKGHANTTSTIQRKDSGESSVHHFFEGSGGYVSANARRTTGGVRSDSFSLDASTAVGRTSSLADYTSAKGAPRNRQKRPAEAGHLLLSGYRHCCRKVAAHGEPRLAHEAGWRGRRFSSRSFAKLHCGLAGRRQTYSGLRQVVCDPHPAPVPKPASRSKRVMPELRSCVDGSGLARTFFTFCSIGSVRTKLRPELRAQATLKMAARVRAAHDRWLAGSSE